MKQFEMGVSKETDTKQSQFAGFLDMHIKIVKGIWGARSQDCAYFYMDLNAGAGEYISLNDGALKDGSPLVFLEKAYRNALLFEAVFMEQDADSMSNLQSAIKRRYPSSYNGSCFFESGDNLLAARNYLGLVPSRNKEPKRYGLIYSDPNRHDMNDWILLSLLSRSAHFQRTDILLNYTASTHKRIRVAHNTLPHLTDLIRIVKKKHVIIREPHDIYQWSFLLFTNWDGFPQWEKKGWYRIDTARGMDILHRLNYSKKEAEQVESVYQKRLLDI